ncbi:alkaline phosphatase family protein [Streptomyces brasiliscabiei]|uniref:alkaline phosphatase family protein n=1 Tax=Streptomyces brasiliscabiei TaxID=2736302 RepID=UPI0030155C4C
MGEGRPPEYGKVLVVGMDGLRLDVLTRTPAAAPILHGLLASGAYGSSLLPYGEVDGQAEGGPSTSMAYTDSGPGWSSVLTGVWPDRHGVTGNDFTGADYARHPDFLSRAAAARPGLRTAAAVSWPELVLRGTLGPGVGTRVWFDGESDGYESADHVVARTAVRWLTEGDPDVLFVYFGATDEAGHTTGPLSPAYDRALLAQDAHLGRLLDAIATRRSDPGRADEHWTVLVTTDHGHLDTGGHGGATRAEREIFVVLAELGARAEGGPGTNGELGVVDTMGTAGTSGFTGTAGRPSATSGLDAPGKPGVSSALGAGSSAGAARATGTHGTPREPGGPPLDSPALVDIAPTVLDRLGIPVDPAWGLRGRVLPRPTTSSLSSPTSERS